MPNRFLAVLIIAIAVLAVPTAVQAAKEENKAASASTSKKGDAKKGEAIFKLICAHCHRTDYEESRVGAPGLKGVMERHDEDWLHQWLKNPGGFSKKNEKAKDLIEANRFGLIMPTLPEMQDEQSRRNVIEYLKTLKGD